MPYPRTELGIKPRSSSLMFAGTEKISAPSLSNWSRIDWAPCLCPAASGSVPRESGALSVGCPARTALPASTASARSSCSCEGVSISWKMTTSYLRSALKYAYRYRMERLRSFTSAWSAQHRYTMTPEARLSAAPAKPLLPSSAASSAALRGDGCGGNASFALPYTSVVYASTAGASAALDGCVCTGARVAARDRRSSQRRLLRPRV